MMELWPFTNFHDLNLDWIVKRIKNVEDSEAAAKASEEAAAESASEAAASAGEAAASEAAAKASEEAAADSASDAADSEANARQAVVITPISTDYLANANVVDQLNRLNSNVNDLVVGDVSSYIEQYLQTQGVGFVVNASGNLALGG